METIFKHFLLIVSAFCFAGTVAGQNPTIDPVAVFTNSESEQTELRPGESYSGSAPLTVEFSANPQDADGWTATYEWRFYTEGNTQQPYLIRYEENTDYTFTSAGTHLVACYAVFKRGDERIEYTEEYWTTEAQPIQISIRATVNRIFFKFSISSIILVSTMRPFYGCGFTLSATPRSQR